MNVPHAPVHVLQPGEQPPQPLELMARADSLVPIDEMRERFEALKETIATVQKGDPNNSLTTKLARETRLAVRAIRIELEKKRVGLTEDLHERKKKIDTAARELRLLMEPIEESLQAIEDHEKIELENRIRALASERNKRAIEEGDAHPTRLSGIDLGRMPAEDFDKLMETLRFESEARRLQKENEAKAAAERAAELERTRAENKRLSDIQAKAAAEYRARQEAEAAARRQAEETAAAERRAREAAEAKLAAQAKAEADRRAAAALEERRKAALPDKGKLMDFSDTVLDLFNGVPEMSTAEGKAAAQRIKSELHAMAKRVTSIAEAL